MPKAFSESLEPRRLFAGVTLITHGWNGRLTGFVDTAAEYITQRLGGPDQAPQYLLTLAPINNVLAVQSVEHVAGTATPQTTSSGEIILIVDWRSVDTNPNVSLHVVADVVADFMMNTPVDGVHLAELPIHEMALSRGTGLLDEIAKSLGRHGVWVDQETYCDPHPISIMGDVPPTVYENVEFVDNYWRTDGVASDSPTNGQSVEGAYNLNTPWLDAHHDGYSLVHLAPASYYNGTINLTTHDGGEGPIYDDWYGTTPEQPARDQTGFYYTRIVGGPRPLSGVWAPSGGSAARVAIGDRQGDQWSNVSDVGLVGNQTALGVGQILQLTYLHEDRDGASTASFYLDRDQNPYNNNFARAFGNRALTMSQTPATAGQTYSTTGIAAGSYWLCAKVTDAQGHTRYSYSQPITIGAAAGAGASIGSGKILRITGSNGNDSIQISRSTHVANSLLVSIGSANSLFSLADVSKIYVYGLDGNDSIRAVEKSAAITLSMRMSGGNGNDTLIGGSGNDLLFGEAGNDRLYGGGGRDHLYGGDGTDRLYGQSGNDWFVGWKKKELMDFSPGDILVS